MGFSLRRENLKRYKDLARLFVKYGRTELVQQAGLEEALTGDEVPAASTDTAALATQLAKDL